MNKNLLIITLLILFSSSSTHAFSFNSLSSYFSSEKYEAVEQQEIPFTDHTQLTLEAIQGAISIQTWEQPKILLKAIKRSNKQESLPHMSIDTKSNNETLIIKTVYNQNGIKGSIEYQLLVPKTTNIIIKSQTGPIKVEQLQARATIHNENGNVELNGIQGPVNVEITNKGSITIDQPGNTIKAITHSGAVDINDAKKSVFASTDNGKIRTSCKAVPKGSAIKLDASSPITLQLPSDINADIQAETEKGNIMCDHFVTIKPFVTQLNAQAWNHFKRNLKGSLGNGGPQICLHSVSGPIKIIGQETV